MPASGEAYGAYADERYFGGFETMYAVPKAKWDEIATRLDAAIEEFKKLKEEVEKKYE